MNEGLWVFGLLTGLILVCALLPEPNKVNSADWSQVGLNTNISDLNQEQLNKWANNNGYDFNNYVSTVSIIESPCGNNPVFLGSDSAGTITVGNGNDITICIMKFKYEWKQTPTCKAYDLNTNKYLFIARDTNFIAFKSDVFNQTLGEPYDDGKIIGHQINYFCFGGNSVVSQNQDLNSPFISSIDANSTVSPSQKQAICNSKYSDLIRTGVCGCNEIGDTNCWIYKK